MPIAFFVLAVPFFRVSGFLFFFLPFFFFLRLFDVAILSLFRAATFYFRKTDIGLFEGMCEFILLVFENFKKTVMWCDVDVLNTDASVSRYLVYHGKKTFWGDSLIASHVYFQLCLPTAFPALSIFRSFSAFILSAHSL